MADYLRLVESRPHSVHDGSHGNGNGGGDDMLERVKNLETKVTSLVTDVAVLKETVATKEALHKELNSQTWKIIVALVVAVSMAVLSKYFLK
ncbi:TPA: hypothetical protein ACJJ17_005087 [Enterobacter hormaechei subsp. xiangfangensis]|uniref:hypothetical protein n=1 Tax=Enterobacter hormaechei TaxID=158836 RepID=UPI001CC2E74A|nr:hypothetical protein [Enterobacter hormaechei]MCC9326765.1 hypothetical protein [Enterobacter hormaechei subsp. steigerwaltii]MCC9352845.1 hypothetical protein [Enterobacter hormaechei subsp. steigerwaltii]MCC9403135.1 hypothetical protein [Enterobacter hormaechei subsp. steigerwaltii]MCO6012490.1 hypothetical protein [Enterobacter hormaechei]MCS0507773.1 hypothetical protein [Enterobacter hormaechei]